MWWPIQWLLVYILGGFTFIPLTIGLGILYIYKYGSVPVDNGDISRCDKARIEAKSEYERVQRDSEEEKEIKSPAQKPLSGWLTVRRQFAPHTQSSLLFTPVTPATPTAPVGIDTPPAETEEAVSDRDDASIKSGTSVPMSTTPSNSVLNSLPTPSASVSGQSTTYSGRFANTYRQLMDARTRKDAPPKENFFCILKGSVLFLYEDEAQSECVAAIGVNKYVVGMENKEGGRFAGKDAEMFAKRNAIVMRIQEKDKNEGNTGLPVLAKDMEGGEVTEEDREVESAPWFLFSKSNTMLEDWYLALTLVSATKPDTKDVFSENDMKELLNTIDKTKDIQPMRWLNAFVGRIFFGLYRTEALEQFIIGKIMKKVSKVPRPSFLGPIIIKEVNVGTFPPIFSNPMLKDLTAEGEASFQVHLNYQSRPNQPNSEVRITIATTAVIPTGFKPISVDLVLAVVVKSFEGNMIMRIKKPPSNRFWYGFTEMPKMEVEIRPVVSARKIQIGMVLKAIEKQLRDVIAESVVLPNMDDIAFFDTTDLSIRGGIFSSAGKVVNGPTANMPSSGVEAPTQPGVEIGTPVDAPPATNEIPGLRRRNPVKSQTVNAHGKAAAPSINTDLDTSITRKDTAPADLAAMNTSAGSAIQGTKKWFASNGRPPSISSLSGIAAINPSKAGLNEPRSTSSDPADSLRSTQNEAKSLTPVDTALSDRTNKAAPASSSPGEPNLSPTDTSSLRSLNQRSFDSSNTGTTVPNSQPSQTFPNTSPQGNASAASLMDSLRARDKKAIISQATTAKDAVKKWGVNWAAKRRNVGGSADTLEGQRPPAMYRPPDEDVDVNGGSAPLSKSAEGHMTLQERLNAAAALANRPKSDSIPSTSPPQPATVKPHSTPSPGKSSKSSVQALGISPPQWTLTTGAPTIGIATADVAAKASVPSPNQAKIDTNARQTSLPKERRGSNSAPVSQQPMAGKSMVVPRVPKRPGEVVGIGSSESGITRRISNGESDAEKVRPAVSSRPDLEPKSGKGNILVPPVLPSRRPGSIRERVPLKKPTDEFEHTTEDLVEGAGKKTAHNDEMLRSDSAPAAMTDLPRLPDRPATQTTFTDGPAGWAASDITPSDDDAASPGLRADGSTASSEALNILEDAAPLMDAPVDDVPPRDASTMESAALAADIPHADTLPFINSVPDNASGRGIKADERDVSVKSGGDGTAEKVLRELQKRDQRDRSESLSDGKIM